MKYPERTTTSNDFLSQEVFVEVNQYLNKFDTEKEKLHFLDLQVHAKWKAKHLSNS